jgi:GDP-D-mannose dehydratase
LKKRLSRKSVGKARLGPRQGLCRGHAPDIAGRCARATGETTLIRVDPVYSRPTEVVLLIGDASKARDKLGWKPKTTFMQPVKEMAAGDLDIARREAADGRNI